MVALLAGVCSLLGLPWMVAATVRSLNHVRSLATSETIGDREHVTAVAEQRLTGLGVHLLIGTTLLFLGLLRQVPLSVLWPRTLGYRPELFRVQDVIGQHEGDARAAAEAVIELVLASSCTPPFTPLLRYRGKIALDGGLIDNVPTFAAPSDARRVLVLLTRTYPPGKLMAENGETIVQPSQPIPVSKWDYTRPDLLRETFDLGRRDGEAFARRHWS